MILVVTSTLCKRNLRSNGLSLTKCFASFCATCPSTKNNPRTVGNNNNSNQATIKLSSSQPLCFKSYIGSPCQINHQNFFFTSKRSNTTGVTSTSGNNEGHNNRYGTQTVIQPLSKLHHPPNHPLTPYITNKILDKTYGSNDSSSNQHKSGDSSFNITFLGTSGSGRPTHARNQSSTCLKINGKLFIFDAGEGTQKQISFVNHHIHILDIYKIFITHLHIDHVGGLTTLILNAKLAFTSSFEMSEKKRNMGTQNEKKKRDNYKQKMNEVLELEIYGPVGLYNYIAMNLALTYSNLYPVKVIVYELVNEYEDEKSPNQKIQKDEQNQGQPRRGEKNQQKKKNHRNEKINGIFHKNLFQGYQNPYLERRVIYKNRKSDTWVISKLPNKKKNEKSDESNIATSSQNKKQHPGRNIHKQVSIEAAHVEHIPHVQTFGYVITEPTPQPKIDVQKATALGIKPSPKYRLLKGGQSVLNDDGTNKVHPHQVLIFGGGDKENNSDNANDIKKGRKFALLGDSFSLSNSMLNISQDCDVLVHEATLAKGYEPLAEKRGHSTGEMAGRVAREVNTKVLLLNHIGGRNDGDQQDINELIRSAEEGCGNSCPVAAAYDFMDLSVPRNGFYF